MKWIAKIIYGIGVGVIAIIVTVIFVVVSLFAWLSDVANGRKPDKTANYYGPLG